MSFSTSFDHFINYNSTHSTTVDTMCVANLNYAKCPHEEISIALFMIISECVHCCKAAGTISM